MIIRMPDHILRLSGMWIKGEGDFEIIFDSARGNRSNCTGFGGLDQVEFAGPARDLHSVFLSVLFVFVAGKTDDREG